jgi:hypothetical protein
MEQNILDFGKVAEKGGGQGQHHDPDEDQGNAR